MLSMHSTCYRQVRCLANENILVFIWIRTAFQMVWKKRGFILFNFLLFYTPEYASKQKTNHVLSCFSTI